MQVAAPFGECHPEPRFARRLPLHRQQAVEPLVRLRHRLAAAADQRSAVAGHPLPHVVDRLILRNVSESRPSTST